MSFEEMTVEHILPKRALKSDHRTVSEVYSINQRSGLTLLCGKMLSYKGKQISAKGCNSWKGRHFDKYLEEQVQPHTRVRKLHTGHQVALFILGYLALYRRYGYQVALTKAGALCRQQFFNPRDFLNQVPKACQFAFMGSGPLEYTPEEKEYWGEPFDISIMKDLALIRMRSSVFYVPISRDPRIPLATSIPYAPSKYVFRADFSTLVE
ncbi:hypothetical protein [Gellertiella hungarica]|uniref:Uncharacterized protein n=2 Tax=Gellertiella hungarica TaxID=1572859 RepID=A0A7W6J2R8_9HYPH|nr:hypothetical protein [Gellertiella hungarica]MBB4063705.1 hypothetical protein [Gellertiella hungarica]